MSPASASGTPVTEPIKEYIKRQLGLAGTEGVVVELSIDQLQDAIDNALRLFNRYLMVTRPYFLVEQTDAVVIELPSTVMGVYDVQFLMPEAARIYAQMTIFEIVHRWFFPGLKLGEWYMLRQFYELYQRVRGTEPDWRYDQSEHKLYLDCWSGPYDVFYIVGEEVDQTELLTGSKRRYEQDYRDLCVAYAKIPLARLLGKWNNVPAPSGALMTDAESLRRESEATIEKIETKLKSIHLAHLLPLYG